MVKVIGAVFIRDNEGKYLAIKYTERLAGSKYVPIGCPLEDNETIRDSVIQKTKSRLGIDIEITGLEAVSEREYADGFWTFIFYGAKIVKGTPKNMEPSVVKEVKWVDFSEIRESSTYKWVK